MLPANESDDDGDGYVECSYSAAQWAGSNQVQGGDDCNDFPGAGAAFTPRVPPDAVGDEIDHDCDGQEQCYLDNDEDGYGSGSAEITSNDLDCSDLGEATMLLATDCNDSVSVRNPVPMSSPPMLRTTIAIHLDPVLSIAITMASVAPTQVTVQISAAMA